MRIDQMAALPAATLNEAFEFLFNSAPENFMQEYNTQEYEKVLNRIIKQDWVKKLSQYRHDIFTSDREAYALVVLYKLLQGMK